MAVGKKNAPSESRGEFELFFFCYSLERIGDEPFFCTVEWSAFQKQNEDFVMTTVSLALSKRS